MKGLNKDAIAQLAKAELVRRAQRELEGMSEFKLIELINGTPYEFPKDKEAA